MIQVGLECHSCKATLFRVWFYKTMTRLICAKCDSKFFLDAQPKLFGSLIKKEVSI